MPAALQSLLMNTRSLILNLLNRRARTINELATELQISRNSTHLQVTRLEAEGRVVKGERRSGQGVGKPAYEYQLAAGAEDSFSGAHKPVLDALLSVISSELPRDNRVSLLRKAGAQMAIDAGLTPVGKPEQDLQNAVGVVNSLGAMAELNRSDTALSVISHSCPIASMVHSQPESCELVAQLFTQATGRTVVSRCKRDPSLICQFTLDR